VNPVGSNGQGYTFFFLFFLIIIIQIPNQVVESFFLINHVIIITKKKKRIWDRIRLHYVGTPLYSRKITNQPPLEFDGNTVKKKRGLVPIV
jgi:hypothetical protein